ncbi:flagellar hook-length control protein FliK [Desulfobotulus alkaliphilus]|uniref:Flagellar hook-length control protein FliK n=1 Tax=Desulfobotulus alkaliphilus TaxID=622671 RepID=A0A562RUX1_9BACT|nr:flagellar hook-length control protein FliK [Desulfobotulus alkaliphilus]TWI72394.1 flagellar hook-length control protein FliK [Desulfobotulus alkaliphilus]
MSFSLSLSSLPGIREQSRLEALLRPGARYSAKVAAGLADGRIRLSFAGQSLLLRPEKPLAPGTFVELRIHATPKGPVLEILPQPVQGEKSASLSSHDFLNEKTPSMSTQAGAGRFSHGPRSMGRVLQLLSSLVQGRSMQDSGASKPGLSLPFLSMASDVKASQQALTSLVRSFFHEPSAMRESLISGAKEDMLFSLASLAEKEGGKEGLELVQDFREMIARNLVDQGRISLPLPLSMDGIFFMGRFFMDLGEGSGGDPDPKVLRAGLDLDLESLGRIRADALLFGKELQLGFRAEDRAVLSLFEEEMPDLVQRLKTLGFRVLPVRYQLLENNGVWEEAAAAVPGDGWGVVV